MCQLKIVIIIHAHIISKILIMTKKCLGFFTYIATIFYIFLFYYKSMPKRLFFFITIITFVAVACRPELPFWKSSYVFPLFEGNLNLQHLVADTLLKPDENDLMHLYYEYDLTSIGMDSLLKGMDTLAYYNYTIPFGTIVQPGYYLIDLQEVKRLGVKGVELNRLDIRSGKMVLLAYNVYSQPIILELHILSAFMNGKPFSLTRTIPAGLYPKRPYVYKEEIDISGLKWYLFTQGTQLYNSFLTRLRIGVSPEATAPLQIHYGDKIYLYIGFKDVDFAYARGWFGQHILKLNHHDKISLFRRLRADILNLDSVRVEFFVRNTFGADFMLTLRQFTGINTYKNKSIHYEGPLLNAPLRIIRAIEHSPEQGLASVREYSFSLSDASNLIEVLENMPDSFIFRVDFTVNPLGNPSAGNDFYYGEPLVAKFIFDLPLNLSFSNLHFTDTFAFSISQKIYPYIQSLTIKTILENYFPIKFNIAFTFLNNDKQFLFKLLSDQEVKAGIICQPQQIVCIPQQTTLYVDMPSDLLSKISDIHYVVIEAFSSTIPQYEKIYIYGNYYLKVKSVAHAVFQISNE